MIGYAVELAEHTFVAFFIDKRITARCKLTVKTQQMYQYQLQFININGRDVQRKNVVNNADKSSLWAS